MRKRLDLTGQRFGRITVLRPAENIGVKTAWVCRCDCGRETVVKTYHLRDGHTRSCGCDSGPQYARMHLTHVDGTCVEIIQSKKIRRNNKSGVTGVDWVPRDRVWRATIVFKGKHYSLGGYRNFEDAVKARKRAEEDMHDRFVREFADMRVQSAIG